MYFKLARFSNRFKYRLSDETVLALLEAYDVSLNEQKLSASSQKLGRTNSGKDCAVPLAVAHCNKYNSAVFAHAAVIRGIDLGKEERERSNLADDKEAQKILFGQRARD